GFAPSFMPEFLFPFQEFIVDWAVRKGRAAIFADCGMGKSPMELVWGQNIIEKTNKPVLLITPLAVSYQMLNEADKFGVEACRAETEPSKAIIHITNYEKLHYYNPSEYGGVILDESSILKNFGGKRRRQITEFMRVIPYRLLGTATAAPNDWVELGTSSEALGYLGYQDMIGKFFTHRQSYRSGKRQDYYIKGWAAKGPFWEWVGSWAMAARKPSDLGFDDNGFILPPLIENDIKIGASEPTPGMLIDMPAVGFHEELEATKRTIKDRCEAVVERVSEHDVSMVWCNRNAEGDLLEKIIPNSVQIAGRHSEEQKVEAAKWFVHGKEQKRILISKPSIFGFGMNFQHSSHATYFPTHSYEGYYQATRRQWRFGQEKPVTIDRIYTNGGKRMLKNLKRKSEQAEEMFEDLIKFMGSNLTLKSNYEQKEINIPSWMN
ncbi:MAG: helicase, partial [Euryarchaeota archaeon]|nr:helicase [Euryarchaeota archaeon]